MTYACRLLVAVVVLTACDGTDAARQPVEEPSPSRSKPPASALSQARASVTAHMPEHLRRAAAVRDAVTLGRLGEARAPATELAHHWPDRVLEEWVPLVKDLRAAAARVAATTDVREACEATADLALACGGCHDAMQAPPEFETPPAPAGGPDMAAAMRLHKWASDRLWDGVVRPADASWSEALAAFAEIPDCRDDVGGEQLTAATAAARESFDAVLDEARTATDLDARARIYGELLQTCNGCHTAGC
jgi:hypothetical protein